MKRADRIFADTNAILAAHKYGCWKALCGYFTMESVEECMVECGTGDPFREGRINVDVALLREQMEIHPVSDLMILSLFQRSKGQSAGIDDGERHLLAYAITQPDVYFLCSPDKACMHVALTLNILDRFVSLEALATKAGMRKIPFRDPFNEKWHTAFCGKLRIEAL